MKKLSIMMTAVLLTGLLTACGSKSEATETSGTNPETVPEVSETEAFLVPENPNADPNADVDLTTLSSTMVYSQVADMMYTPEKYDGKIIKASGQFSVYHDDTQDKNYYAILIQDAAACCAQGH